MPVLLREQLRQLGHLTAIRRTSSRVSKVNRWSPSRCRNGRGFHFGEPPHDCTRVVQAPALPTRFVVRLLILAWRGITNLWPAITRPVAPRYFKTRGRQGYSTIPARGRRQFSTAHDGYDCPADACRLVALAFGRARLYAGFFLFPAGVLRCRAVIPF
jgi:hypothetical protein